MVVSKPKSGFRILILLFKHLNATLSEQIRSRCGAYARSAIAWIVSTAMKSVVLARRNILHSLNVDERTVLVELFI